MRNSDASDDFLDIKNRNKHYLFRRGEDKWTRTIDLLHVKQAL